ncbi:hypothetical protein V5F89_00435 [Pelagerythrobacter marensis]|uniref:DUF4440 domain-containing protein n=1 Tax=Pelagerythrobacter marensis TaxID=543877 RepID=A0ABZ2DAN6_9SPHN
MEFRYRTVSLAALALALSACGEADRRTEGPGPEALDTPASPAPSPTAAAAAGSGRESAGQDGAPAPDPARLIPESEKGEAGARKVLQDFARAVEFEDFDRAYAMLGDDAREEITRADFTALFENFDGITVLLPPGRMDGAAGSLYYEVPTTITGENGRKLTGTTVLRRVNDVPGATAEQLRWRIQSFEVSPG